MAKASFSSFVIPDDPLISPLYEAMFPFSVFSSSTTPCDVLLPSDSSSSPSSSSSSCLPSDLFLSALLDREVSIRIPTAGSSNLKPFSIASNQANTWGKYYKQLPLSLFPDYSSSYDDQHPIADGESLLIAPGVVFDLQQSTNPAAAPTATKLQDPKNKYYCEACKVGFGTSQALGGHMSSHSKGVAAAGEDGGGNKTAREFRLDITTAFSVVLKMGVGDFGSPSAWSPLSMSAEFGLLGSRPTFSLFLKPRFGDFAFRKSVSSATPAVGGASSGVAVKVTPVGEGHTPIVEFRPSDEIQTGGKLRGFPIDIPALTAGNGGGIEGLLSGFEVSARSSFPIALRTAVHFNWGLRIPPELRTAFDDPTARISLRKLPLLAINKISVERLTDDKKAKEEKKNTVTTETEDVCRLMRREVAALQAETWQLGKAVEELRADVSCWKLSPEASPVAWKRDRGKPLEKARRSEDMSAELMNPVQARSTSAAI